MAENALVKLSPKEQERFAELESICTHGRAVFFMVGIALQEIKDKEFFKAKGFESFATYCESIGYTKRHCNQLIIDAEVVKALPENLRTVVQSERAARALAKLPPMLRVGVVIEVSEGGKKTVTEAQVKKSTPSKPPPRKQKTSKAPTRKQGKTAKSEPVATWNFKDGTGLVVPKESDELWSRIADVNEELSYLSAIKTRLKKHAEEKDLLFVECDLGEALLCVDKAIVEVKRAKPYAVCPTCQGKLPKDCLQCKGRGFVSEFYWKNMIPEEVRVMRETHESNATESAATA